MTGTLVAFEGADGSGKSTQARLLARVALHNGRTVTLTRQPGGTPLGLRLRTVLLDDPFVIHPMAEAFLFAADRAQHVGDVIRPALAAGDLVITDRYVDSSVAYQGAGRGLGADVIRDINWIATGGLVPDITIILDMDPADAHRRATAHTEDRIEAAGVAFQERVRAGLLECAAAAPGRYVIVNAAGAPSDVHGRVINALGRVLYPDNDQLGVTHAAL